MKLFEIREIPKTWLLCEAAEGKNVHLEHVEDLIYNEGYSGAQQALNYMESLRKMFAQGEGSPVKVTVKWDGAPAIICGIDPVDGKFFVGTKSVFSKTEPKLCKSTADIKKFYGEAEGLAAKLEVALKYLSKLGMGGVLQGDLMFTPGDLEQININGQDYITFTPQLITYAVPIDSLLAKKILRAKIGIIFHTKYEGDTIGNMQAEFGASVEGLTPSNDVWFDDAFYKDLTGRASLTPEQDQQIKNLLLAAATTLGKIKESEFDRIIFSDRQKNEYTEFGSYIKPFINNMVRGGTQVGEPTKFLQNFINFYRGKMEGEIDKLMKEANFTDPQEELIHRYMATQNESVRKTIEQELVKSGVKAAVVRRIEKIVANEEFMENNSNTLLGILAIYKRVIECKSAILAKMQQVESMGTFIKTDDGYKVTAPEGFVAIGHDGSAVKLVDRIEFSRANFLTPKQWKK